MTKETNAAEVTDVEETEETGSENWEAKYAALKERQRSAKTTYDKRIADLETELKNAKKSPEIANLKTDLGLMEKGFLRVAGITAPDEVDLIRKWQKDTNKPIDELVDHPFVKAELETLRQTKANQVATDITGTSKGSGGKDTVEYWLDKDERPTDKKLRAKVLEAKLKQEKSGRMFYDD